MKNGKLRKGPIFFVEDVEENSSLDKCRGIYLKDILFDFQNYKGGVNNGVVSC